MTNALFSRALLVFSVLAIAGTGLRPAVADIDPDGFPEDLRALEWRGIGPYRGGRSAAVAGGAELQCDAVTRGRGRGGRRGRRAGLDGRGRLEDARRG